MSCNPKLHSVALGRDNVDLVQQQKVEEASGNGPWQRRLFNGDAEGSSTENIYQQLPSREEICCREKCKYYSAGQGQRK